MRKCFLANLLIFAFALSSVVTEDKGVVLAKLKVKRDNVVREWNAEELVHMETINRINDVMHKRPVFFKNVSEERQTRALQALLVSGKSPPLRRSIRSKKGGKYPTFIKGGKVIDNSFMENIQEEEEGEGEGTHKTLRMRIVDAYLESSNAKHTAGDLFHVPPSPQQHMNVEKNRVSRRDDGLGVEEDDDDVFNSGDVDGVFLLILVALPGVAAVVVLVVIAGLISSELWKWGSAKRKVYMDNLIGQGPPPAQPPPSAFFSSSQFHAWKRTDVQIPGNKI
jgi:hypothetical protein